MSDSERVRQLIRDCRIWSGRMRIHYLTAYESKALANVLAFTIAGEGDMTELHEVNERVPGGESERAGKE